MTTGIEFRVRGIPAPQGSLQIGQANGRTWLRQSNKKTMPWRDDIRHAASQEMDRNDLAPFSTALDVAATFVLPRPKSLPKKYDQPVSKPDLDKLTRAALDAMTGVVYIDDSQVVRLSIAKVYTDEANPPGVTISILPVAGGKPR